MKMLLIENRIPNEEVLGHQKPFNVEDFVYPHGLTPPLRHVRKRRFRKRASKRTIESVEQEVERLLQQDELATEMKYGTPHIHLKRI
jgi:transcription initiation factor TFIID subunit 7